MKYIICVTTDPQGVCCILVRFVRCIYYLLWKECRKHEQANAFKISVVD